MSETIKPTDQVKLERFEEIKGMLKHINGLKLQKSKTAKEFKEQIKAAAEKLDDLLAQDDRQSEMNLPGETRKKTYALKQ